MTVESLQKGDLLLIDKPKGWTSFDVINKVRRFINTKCGHAGTLDPLATGLLIICTGPLTKRISQFQDLEKEYEATIVLGATTPSYDLETSFDRHFSINHINEDLIRTTLSRFKGPQKQTPPIFSAKYTGDGRRAYHKARSGEYFEMKANDVEVHELDILKIEMPRMVFRIVCSKGFYVRSFAHDFGLALNSGAHLEELRRTRIGNFNVSEALTINEFVFLMQQENAGTHAN